MGKIAPTFRGEDHESLLVLLQKAQSRLGYVSPEFIFEAARSLNIPVSEVYGVASFYSFLSTKPLGRNVIRVCQSPPCGLKNSRIVIESVADEVGVRPGETTPDGKFSFQLTNCIGACDEAPAMLINRDLHVSLTPGKIPQILKSYE